jgi:hypothetical protein
MKVEFWCDNGANIHSCRKEVVDLVEDWGFSEKECAELSEDDIHQLACDWANETLDIGGHIVEE